MENRNPNIMLTERNGVPVVTFSLFRNYPELVAVNSTRLGGVSANPFESMNLGFNRGDDEENVRENYRRFCKACDVPFERLVFPKQTHTDHVRTAVEEDAGNGMVRPIPYDDIDGQVTDVRNLPLLAFGSDCVPIFFYDPVRHAVGAAHAGWRGTVSGIAGRTVSRMESEFGSKPSDILAVIGPSICGSCFEIGAEVAEQFEAAFPDAEACGIVTRKNKEKWTADLWKANRQRLLSAGLTEEHIEVSGECTMCHPDRYWSHRATGGIRGSNASVIMLR